MANSTLEPDLEPNKQDGEINSTQRADQNTVSTVTGRPHGETGSFIDLAAANHQVANYLAQIGWSEEAAVQRAGRLVVKARESLEDSETSVQMTQRQLVRSALAFAIESAAASTAAQAVPTICMQPMVGGGQARRVKWLRADWWLSQLHRA